MGYEQAVILMIVVQILHRAKFYLERLHGYKYFAGGQRHGIYQKKQADAEDEIGIIHVSCKDQDNGHRSG